MYLLRSQWWTQLQFVFDICCSFSVLGRFLFVKNQTEGGIARQYIQIPKGKPVETQGRKVKGPNPQNAVWQPIAFL